MCNWLWPQSEKLGRRWHIQTSYEPMARCWNNEEGWRSSQPQKSGAFFEIDLRKERIIKAIQFYHGDSFETPKKWYMFIMRKSHDFGFFGCNIVRKEGQGSIIVFLEEPQKLQFIQVIIVEPEIQKNGQPYYWTIKEVKLREVRIPHLWEPIIK